MREDAEDRRAKQERQGTDERRHDEAVAEYAVDGVHFAVVDGVEGPAEEAHDLLVHGGHPDAEEYEGAEEHHDDGDVLALVDVAALSFFTDLVAGRLFGFLVFVAHVYSFVAVRTGCSRLPPAASLVSTNTSVQ